jgi:hypothetical protein
MPRLSFALCVSFVLWFCSNVMVGAAPADGFFYDGPGGATSTCSKAVCNYNGCADGKKLSGCTAGSPGACIACDNAITSGYYYSDNAPTSAGNCPQTLCPSCNQGSVKTLCGSGDGTAQGTACATCGTPPLGKYWGPNTNAMSNCPQLDKRVCSAGTYNTASTDLYEGTCTACSATLVLGNYWAAPTVWNSVCTQLPKTVCPDGKISSDFGAYSTTLPGTCSLCPALTNNEYYYGVNANYASNCPKLTCSASTCAIGQYKKDCGTVSPWTSPGVCAVCTNAPASNQVYETTGSYSGTCGVKGCPTGGCALGQYVTGCGGAPTALGCAACTTAVASVSFYASIGLTASCVVNNCKVCGNGFYTAGCTVLADGTCTGCTN